MKTLFKILFFFIAISITSCNYLDIVPDERPTENDAFKDVKAAERYLYSCYSYLPNPRNGTSSLDLMTGDEVVTAFEHETFANFPKGNFTATNPIISYWNTLFQGIRQCYIFRNNVAKVPGISTSTVTDYIAQADFLIAYYHFLLIRSYGPVILVKEEPLIDTAPSNYLPRSPYDECVQYVCDLLDESAKNLPASRSGNEYGLATSLAAKSIKARLLLYAASPLFNGNSEFYADFKNNDGSQLMPLTYDPQKWVKAANAAKEAITLAESAGYRLYQGTDAAGLSNNMPEPKDLTQRALRFAITDRDSKEILWADTRREGTYGLGRKSMPFMVGTWNGIAPTLNMLERFYTKNGLPIDEDPQYPYDRRYEATTFAPADSGLYGEGETQVLNVNREPRYYSWISFHNGYYEVQGTTDNTTADQQANYAYLPKYKRGDFKVITRFLKNDNCGRMDRNNNFSQTGFLNKKGVRPDNVASKDFRDAVDYPWPVVRLAELYLNYAEACAESGQLDEAKTYLNKVRTRAGIPTVEESWAIAGVALNQQKLIQIVRQERQIEFYLENQNFWDLRRWKIAEQYFGEKPKGMGVTTNTFSSFIKPVDVNVTRSFNSPQQYLMPIPLEETNKNVNLVQNPNY